MKQIVYQKCVNNLLTHLYRTTDREKIGVTAHQSRDCNNSEYCKTFFTLTSLLLHENRYLSLFQVCKYLPIRSNQKGQYWSFGGSVWVAGTSPATSVVQKKCTDCFQAINGINSADYLCQSIQCEKAGYNDTAST